MYAVELSDKNSISAPRDFFESELDDILDEMFLSVEHLKDSNDIIDEEHWNRKKNQIADIYKTVFDKKNRIPTLLEIMDEVFEINNELLFQLIDLEYNFGRYGEHSYYCSEFEHMDEEDVKERLEECWIEDINNTTGYGCDMEYLAFSLLTDLHCVFSIRECYFWPSEEWPEGCEILVNDCQNLLLKEWHTASLNECCVNIDEDENKIKLLIQIVSE